MFCLVSFISFDVISVAVRSVFFPPAGAGTLPPSPQGGALDEQERQHISVLLLVLVFFL
jgi:hypothetical protein